MIIVERLYSVNAASEIYIKSKRTLSLAVNFKPLVSVYLEGGGEQESVQVQVHPELDLGSFRFYKYLSFLDFRGLTKIYEKILQTCSSKICQFFRYRRHLNASPP